MGLPLLCMLNLADPNILQLKTSCYCCLSMLKIVEILRVFLLLDHRVLCQLGIGDFCLYGEFSCG